MVFTDATLQLIAEHRPDSETALLRINGIGQSKLERYGEAVLAVVGAGSDDRRALAETGLANLVEK